VGDDVLANKCSKNKSIKKGGESASLHLQNLYNQKRGCDYDGSFGSDREFHIDLIPKFIIGGGILVKILLITGVSKYIDFVSVAGSYVMKGSDIYKVPSNDTEALKSSLVSLSEKNRAKKFFVFVQDYEPENPDTHKGMDLENMPMSEVFSKFGDFSKATIDFIGHSLALHRDDSYLDQPAAQTIQKIKLYCEAMIRYGKSPYLYPKYGLGELSQGFARIAAVYGGTFMLRKPVDEVVKEDGVVVGVRSGDEIARCKYVIGDPSYLPDKAVEVGKVVRSICLLDHPIHGTKKAKSCQVIIPQNQCGRNNDIYVFAISHTHQVCPKGMFIAIASTTVETDDPEEELEPAFKLIGDTLEKFTFVTPLFEAKDDGVENKCFVSTSFDATSHFETTCDDILSIYERVVGRPFDLNAPAMKCEDFS